MERDDSKLGMMVIELESPAIFGSFSTLVADIDSPGIVGEFKELRENSNHQWIQEKNPVQ